MHTRCRAVVGDRRFQQFILGTILLNAALLGLATFDSVIAVYGRWLMFVNTIIQVVFVVEIAVRVAAHWPQPGAFFRNGWNVFDFSIVAASLLPAVGVLATIGRLARLLRIARIASSVPGLRLIIGTMLRSIPSMGHVLALLGLLMYVYAVVGHSLFAAQDPRHWGSLATSLGTLFQIMTLEGWVEIQSAGTAVYRWAWLFYTSFIVVAVFVVINLFIAVVINNLEAAKAEEGLKSGGNGIAGAADRLRALQKELAELEQILRDVPAENLERRTVV